MALGFLDRVAAELNHEFGNDMAKAVIVLPNRRSAGFLGKAISKRVNGPVLLPRMRSIQDQIEEWSGLRIVSPTHLLLRFYQVYKKVSKASDESLTSYLRWANMFLTDVDEIDMELVNHEALFEHLLSAERIATWNVGDGGPTDLQKRHLQFVERFKPYYTALRADLLKDRQAYGGMAYRAVASNIESIIKKEDGNQIWFVGFNALHKSEKQIIKAFQNHGIGRSFWDADSFYLNDGGHEAGKFLRQNKRAGLMNDGLNWETDELVETARAVRIVSATGTTGQVSVAGKLLSDIVAEENFQPLKTAIVLNDESQLIPLLHAFPKVDHRFNITMGYPIRQAALSQFVDSLFRLHVGYRRYGERFHRSDVLRVFRHPVLGKKRKNGIKRVIELAGSSVYLNVDDLIEKVKDLESILRPPRTSDDALNLIGSSLNLVDSEKEDKVGLAVLGELRRLQAELSEMVDEAISLEEMHLLWRQLVRSTTVSFAGEPLEGIQVMGMLETRLLDFDNIIMMGCNEGTLPNSSTLQTFIPFDIRKSFGLQTHLDKDAVFSYHFYRLLQRATNVNLLYDSNTESFGKGEPSRFLQQLKIEAPERTTIDELSVGQQEKPTDFDALISIVKGEFELERISSYLEKGISPSGINVFSRCELMFYFRYVLSLGEDQELEESIDHAEFGTVVHHALEKLYEPLIGEPLTTDRLKDLLTRSAQQTEQSFTKETHTNQKVEGKNLLALGVAKKYVGRAINADLQYLKENGEESLTVIATEGKAAVNLGAFNLAGTIDRIDLTSEGTLRILDYKTGKVEARELKLDAVEELLHESQSAKALQLLSYALLIPEMKEPFLNVSLGIIPLRSSGEPLFLNVEKQELFDLGELTISAAPVIKALVGRISDPDLNFNQTDDLGVCATCSYRNICNR